MNYLPFSDMAMSAMAAAAMMADLNVPEETFERRHF